MTRIATTMLVFLAAMAASIARVQSAPLGTEIQDSTTVCSSHGAQGITKWPRNVVPYTIGSNFTAPARGRLMDSIHYLENSSCVLFIPRTDELDYVFFKLSTKCCSHYGKMGQGKQEVYFSDNCLQEGFTINRVLHYLIGDENDGPLVSSKSDLSSESITMNEVEEGTNRSSGLSHTTTSCTNSCQSCILLQPPSEDGGSGPTARLISSPNYPDYYPDLSDCVWKLIAPAGYFISLRFMVDIDLEGGKDCMYDFLDIFLLDTHGELLVDKKHYCGSKSASLLNADLTSESEMHTQAVVVRFHSDGNYGGAGFQVNYTLQANRSDPCSVNNGGCEQVCTNNNYVDASCGCREGYTLGEDGHSCRLIDLCELKYKEGGCQQRCTNNSGSYQCFCKPGYRLNDDQRSCLECGGVYNDSQGVIQSQNFPLPYPYEQNCKWTVHPWPEHYLRIAIMHLDIYPTERCMGDFLKLEKANFPHQSRLCGHYSDISYVIDSSIYFRFRSKNTNTNYGGFHLEYSQVHNNELSSLEKDYVTINGRLIPYDDRLWILPSL